MALPDETIKKIHKALEDSGGSIAAAAVLMGWQSKKLHTTIANTYSLRERWLKAGEDSAPMNDVQAANRPNKSKGDALPVIIPSNEHVDITGSQVAEESLAQENDRFGETLKAIGITKDIAEVAKNLQGLTQLHFKSGLELMHGGLQHTFLSNVKETSQVQPLFEMVASELKDTDKYPLGSKERSDLIREMDRLHEILSDIKESTVKVNEVIHKSALVQAALKQRKNKKKSRKTGSLNG